MLLQFAHCYSAAPYTVTSLLVELFYFIIYCSPSLTFQEGKTCLFLLDSLSNFITILSNCLVEVCFSSETNILCLAILRLLTSSPI